MFNKVAAPPPLSPNKNKEQGPLKYLKSSYKLFTYLGLSRRIFIFSFEIKLLSGIKSKKKTITATQ